MLYTAYQAGGREPWIADKRGKDQTDGGNISGKVFLGCPQGQRRRGRAKLRWQDGVERTPLRSG